MSILSFLFAALLEQIRPLRLHHVLHRFAIRWQRYLMLRLDANTNRQAWFVWALAVLVPALLAYAVHMLLLHGISWFAALLWNVLVLYACLGFKPFNGLFARLRAALAVGDERRVQAIIVRGLSQNQLAPPLQTALPSNRLVGLGMKLAILTVYRQFFGLVLLFVLCAWLGLGPMGAVLFLAAELAWFCWGESAVQQPLTERASGALSRVSRKGWFLVNWLPSRAIALLFSAAGNFESAYTAWRNMAAANPMDTDAVVVAAAAGALGVELVTEPVIGGVGGGSVWEPDCPQQRMEMAGDVLNPLASLIWRAAVLCLVLFVTIGMIMLVA